MRALALLLMTACRFGFDATSRSDALIDTPDAPPDAPPPTQLQIDIILITQLDVCLIGDTCASNCITIQNSSNVDQFKFTNNANFHAVAPGDPRIATAQVSKCLHTTLDAGELANLHAVFDQLAATVSSWSNDTLALDLRYHEVATSAMGLFNQTLWLDEGSIPASILPALGASTDLVYIVNDRTDAMQALHMTTQYCGLNYGTDNSPKGYAYVWHPSECVSYDNERNYFIGELHRAIHRLTTFSDAYNSVYPPCGAATGDPATWFPDPGLDCATDPDSSMCGTTCTSINDDFHHHIIERHWVRDRTTTLNHCADGMKDYDESDVDTGGSCL